MLKNILPIFAIVIFLITFSGCNNALVKSDVNLETNVPFIEKNPDFNVNSETIVPLVEENSDVKEPKTIAQIDYNNNIYLSVSAKGNDVDVIFTKDETEHNVISHTMFSDDYIVKKHSEYNQDFLIIAEPIIGAAYPATIVTIVNDRPVILSDLDNFNDNEKYMGLFFCIEGDLICDRGDSISVGATSIVPYYWNSSITNFKSFELSRISIDELYDFDKDNIVSDKSNVESIYKRNNGLVHVNYNNSDVNSNTSYSKTYVLENDRLRSYKFDTDFKYGFFLENFHITPNEILIDNANFTMTGCKAESDDINYSSTVPDNRALEILFFNQLKSEINATDTLDLYFTDINSDGNVDVIMRPVENVTGTEMGIFQQMYFYVYNEGEFIKVSEIDNFSEEYEFCVRSYESEGGLLVINGAYSFSQGADSSLPEKMISEDIIRIKISPDAVPLFEAKRIMYMHKDFESGDCVRAYVGKAFADEIDLAVNEIPEWSRKNYYAVSEDKYKNISEEYFNTLASEIPIEYGRFTAEDRNEYTSEQLVGLLVIQ